VLDDKLRSSERKIHPGNESVAVQLAFPSDPWFIQLWNKVSGADGQNQSVSHVKEGMSLTSGFLP